MYHHILRCALVMSLALFPVSFRGAEKVEADSLGTPRKLELKTNLPAWGFLMGNAAAELQMTRHLSLEIPVYYSAVNYFSRVTKFRVFAIQPQLRWNFSGMDRGWFAEAHFSLASFNIAVNGAYRYQDYLGHHPAMGAGIGVGYRMPIGRSGRWNLEFSAGAGWLHLDYTRFENRHNGPAVDRVQRDYWGLDRLAVSVGYVFDLANCRCR